MLGRAEMGGGVRVGTRLVYTGDEHERWSRLARMKLVLAILDWAWHDTREDEALLWRGYQGEAKRED